MGVNKASKLFPTGKPPKLRKCRTVGMLIKELEKLPKNLPLQIGFSECVRPVVSYYFSPNNDSEKTYILDFDNE